MGELANCPKCNGLFVKTQLRTVCNNCYKEEEQAYEKVYKFLKKRENRKAELDVVVEKTGVSKDVILKFIRQGRILLSNFPNLGYPCEKCGKTIREERLCQECKADIHKQLDQMDQEKVISERNKQPNRQTTFYSQRPK